MKIRELIKIEQDIDVYDDVCEELGIAFCGPMELTEVGENYFAEVLDYECEMLAPPKGYGCGCVIVHVDGENWKKKLRRAKAFFESMAGYCADDDYQRWFKKVD